MEIIQDKNSANCTLNDDSYEEMLDTILAQSKIEKYSDVKKSILEEEDKLKGMEDSKVNKLDCIKVNDTDNDDFFKLNSQFEMTVGRWTTVNGIQRIMSQLSENGLYDFGRVGKPNVSPMCSVENMVESTYMYDKSMMYQMAEEICYMRLLAFRWRPIGGDGNCFYRSVMYSYLENLIFQRDIAALQRIIVDISEKFEENYPNTKRLPKEVRNTFTQLDKKIITTLLKIIFDILDTSPGKEAVYNALIVLAKSFNVCKSFDTAMILYLRYKLYEFILDNKDKFFSEDFPVKLGNLLPFQYETDSDFLYDKFFSEELLKLYTYAEKIAIYLTPFVLRINLRLIFYDYGKDCNIQTKDFLCTLSNKETLMILYRKAHYDVAYSQDYFNKYSSYMTYFTNYDDKMRVVNESLLDYYKKNEVNEVDTAQSKIFNKKEKNIPHKPNQEKLNTTTSSANNANNTTCASINQVNKLNTTISISNEIASDNGDNLELLQEKYLKLQKEIERLKLASLNNENDCESKEGCIMCKKGKTSSESNFILTCSCYLCSKECASNYSDCLLNNNNFSLNLKKGKCEYLCNINLLDPIVCSNCKYSFNIKELMQISSNLSEKCSMPVYRDNLIKKFTSQCMRCLKPKDCFFASNRKYKDTIFKQFLHIKHLEHAVCGDCAKLRSNDCLICESHHLHVLN